MARMGPGRRFAAFRRRAAAPRSAEGEADAAPPAGGADEAGAPPRPRLVVGLGNPGGEHRYTRHNVGAWCVGRLAERRGARLARGRRAWTATLEIGGGALHLAWPRAYVNESGPPVAAELARLGLRRGELLVVYDEIDLPVGEVRARPHGGHGGHNGMRSLLGALGGGGFPRVRIGVDRPYDDGRPVRDPDRVADWVLAKPPPGERARLDAAVERAADAIEIAAREGVEAAMRSLAAGA